MAEKLGAEERIIPGVTDDRVYDYHASRYDFASRFVRGKRVLDVAGGTGYGTEILLRSGGALTVTGLDKSPDAIEYARAHFTSPSLDFVLGDAIDMPFGDGTFEVVVSFETIEHIKEPRRFLAEISRVLRADGTLVISTPNRAYDSKNPFHVTRFSVAEFAAPLRTFFENVELFGQMHLSLSARLVASCSRAISRMLPVSLLDSAYRARLKISRGSPGFKSEVKREQDLDHCRNIIAVCSGKRL
jgi:ubiquinone/menaquinone biosynthesis C-methylase UbiE